MSGSKQQQQQQQKSVVIYGGRGALGKVLVSFFKQNNVWVCSIGHGPNEEADANVILTRTRSDDWEKQSTLVHARLNTILSGQKVDGIFNVAGGWAGGNAASADLVTSSNLMWQQSVWTAAITAGIAAEHLQVGGVVVLSGALAAHQQGTPGMIGYGMCKAAVHQLTQSLAETGAGLPRDAHALCVLPVTLDTPTNRKFMGEADQTAWTPLEDMAKMFSGWMGSGCGRPVSGSLVKVVTEDSVTRIEVV